MKNENKLSLPLSALIQRWVCFILEGHHKAGGGSFYLLLRVRLKDLFLYLLYIIVFAVIFLVAVINSYYQSVHVLEQDRFSLFLGRDRILNLTGKPLVIVMAQNTILPTQLRGIAYRIHIVSENLVTGLYVEIIQYVGHFTNRVQETKMLTQLINKQVLVREPYYNLDSVLTKRHTLILNNTRELNGVLSTTYYLIYKLMVVYAILL